MGGSIMTQQQSQMQYRQWPDSQGVQDLIPEQTQLSVIPEKAGGPPSKLGAIAGPKP